MPSQFETVTPQQLKLVWGLITGIQGHQSFFDYELFQDLYSAQKDSVEFWKNDRRELQGYTIVYGINVQAIERMKKNELSRTSDFTIEDIYEGEYHEAPAYFLAMIHRVGTHRFDMSEMFFNRFENKHDKKPLYSCAMTKEGSLILMNKGFLPLDPQGQESFILQYEF